MKPLTVYWVHEWPPILLGAPKTAHIDLKFVNSPPEIKEVLRRLIDQGDVDVVFMYGPLCTGWRLTVNRKVRFMKQASFSKQDAIKIDQAAVRIIPAGFPERKEDLEIVDWTAEAHH